jgi:hypothetical protein
MSETSALNDQIRDAVAQINAAAGGVDRSLIAAAAYQAIAQAIALAMQNAVAQQQQGYILRNALTGAAASAILDGKKEEADSILAMMESRLVSPGIAAEIGELLTALKAVDAELQKFNRSAPAEPEAPPSETTPA